MNVDVSILFECDDQRQFSSFRSYIPILNVVADARQLHYLTVGSQKSQRHLKGMKSRCRQGLLAFLLGVLGKHWFPCLFSFCS